MSLKTELFCFAAISFTCHTSGGCLCYIKSITSSSSSVHWVDCENIRWTLLSFIGALRVPHLKQSTSKPTCSPLYSLIAQLVAGWKSAGSIPTPEKVVSENLNVTIRAIN